MKFFESEEIKIIKNGTILLREGDICKFGCSVIKGCLISYVHSDNGKEHIMQFAPEGWIITDMNSLYNQVPSGVTIQAIEDSEVRWLYGNTTAVWQNATREDLIKQIELLTRNIITANKRTIMLLNATAEQRYIDFIETYPTLQKRLPLKLIASYIGITPEYLSEIRKKIAGH